MRIKQKRKVTKQKIKGSRQTTTKENETIEEHISYKSVIKKGFAVKTVLEQDCITDVLKGRQRQFPSFK